MIIDKGKFYGCEGYKEGCRFTLPKKLSNKAIPKKQIQELLENGVTTKINGFKSKNGKSFSAKLSLTKENKIEFVF